MRCSTDVSPITRPPRARIETAFCFSTTHNSNSVQPSRPGQPTYPPLPEGLRVRSQSSHPTYGTTKHVASRLHRSLPRVHIQARRTHRAITWKYLVSFSDTSIFRAYVILRTSVCDPLLIGFLIFDHLSPETTQLGASHGNRWVSAFLPAADRVAANN